jgi:fumarate hydratase class II
MEGHHQDRSHTHAGRNSAHTGIEHYALDKDLTLKQAALELGFVSEDQFDRVVDPAKMVQPYVATSS